MKLVAQYVEQAKLFEFLAASELDPKSKEQFEEQAKTYYGLAAERAQVIGVAVPEDVHKPVRRVATRAVASSP